MSSTEEFKSYWNDLDAVLVEKELDPEKTIAGYRIHKFVQYLNDNCIFPEKPIDVARFRLNEIHNNAVQYARENHLIDNYPYMVYAKSILDNLIEEKH